MKCASEALTNWGSRKLLKSTCIAWTSRSFRRRGRKRKWCTIYMQQSRIGKNMMLKRDLRIWEKREEGQKWEYNTWKHIRREGRTAATLKPSRRAAHMPTTRIPIMDSRGMNEPMLNSWLERCTSKQWYMSMPLRLSRSGQPILWTAWSRTRHWMTWQRLMWTRNSDMMIRLRCWNLTISSNSWTNWVKISTHRKKQRQP